MKRIMIIAGEASGDLHGSGLVKQLKLLSPDIDIYGVGGDKMSKAGMELIYNIKELGFMGFVEVIKHLPQIKTMEHVLEQILKFKKPDVLVLIDYPGFNLRFAKKAKQYGIKICYYISPQVWAWHKSRIKKIKTLVDKMFVVFPFEVDFYKNEGMDVEFVGHPLLEVLEAKLDKKNFCKRFNLDATKKIIALLPGSRKQEIDRIFPEMLSAANIIKQKIDVEIILAIAPTIDADYLKTLYNLNNIHLIKNLQYDVMANSDIAIVTSGTATLETACFATPMIVVYKTSPITYLIGKALVKLKNIGLVNIVAGKRIVPELIQHKANAKNIAKTLLDILENKERLEKMQTELKVVKGKLGNIGASHKVANSILKMI